MGDLFFLNSIPHQYVNKLHHILCVLNKLLQKALSLLAVLMMAGMAYMAYYSYNFKATVPSLSMDAYIARLGEKIQYAQYSKHRYVAVSDENGTVYIWKNGKEKVLIIDGTDTVLLNTANLSAVYQNQSGLAPDALTTATYAENWQLTLLAGLGPYGPLMGESDKSFVASNQSDRLRVRYPENNIYGLTESVWTIGPEYVINRCDAIMNGDTIVVQYNNWQRQTDSFYFPSIVTINRKNKVLRWRGGSQHAADLGFGKLEDF